MRSPVAQLDGYGCGVACVAYVVGRSYEDLALSMGKARAQTIGFMCRDLQAELAKYNIYYNTCYFRPKIKNQIYQDGVIVFIKRSNRYPAGHYLTFCDGYWMDPWINFVKDKDVSNAQAGYRKRLPGQAQYALVPCLEVNKTVNVLQSN